MDILVIAPTGNFNRNSRSPEQREINDTIKDQTDAVNLEKKFSQVVPKSAQKSPTEQEMKRYHDMRAVHSGVPKQDDRAREWWFNRHYNQYKNDTSYPETNDSERNARHLRGLDT